MKSEPSRNYHPSPQECERNTFVSVNDWIFQTVPTQLQLVSSSVIAATQTDKPSKLLPDACDYAIGAILVQEDNAGLERVVQYISHSLSSTQRKWATIEKEAYAVVYAVNSLRPYLYGAQFTVCTDHKPLTCFFTRDMQNTQIERWDVLLTEFGAQIKYRKGKNNIIQTCCLAFPQGTRLPP